MAKAKMTATRRLGVYRRTMDGRPVTRGTARGAGGKMFNRFCTMPEGATLPETIQAATVVRHQALRESMGVATPSPLPAATGRAAGVATVEEFAHRWLDQKKQRVKPATYRHYEDTMMTKILPSLGHLEIADVCRGAVESWVAWSEQLTKTDGSPYAQPTLQSWWRPLATMMRDLAADHDIIDPTRRVRPPEAPSVAPTRERRTLNRVELRAFLAAVLQFAPQRHAEIATLAFTGMRPGELFALKRDCVDFEANKIVVRRSISDGKLTETTKAKAWRTVPMPELLATILGEHQQRVAAHRWPGSGPGLVFASETGTPRHTSSLTKPFGLAAEAAGLDIRVSPLVLRRTFNTLLVLRGADRITVRAMMGHTSEQMTARYAGVPLEAKAAAVEDLFGELSSGRFV